MADMVEVMVNRGSDRIVETIEASRLAALREVQKDIVTSFALALSGQSGVTAELHADLKANAIVGKANQFNAIPRWERDSAYAQGVIPEIGKFFLEGMKGVTDSPRDVGYALLGMIDVHDTATVLTAAREGTLTSGVDGPKDFQERFLAELNKRIPAN